MIKKTMCLGGLCEGFIFSNIIGTRVLGPVDNFQCYNFTSILTLFDGTLFNDILNDKILFEKINEYKPKESSDYDEDKYLRYYVKNNNEYNWISIHNDFRLLKNKEKFKSRIDNFNKFNKDAINDSSMFYIYTVTWDDYQINIDDIDYVLSQLPNYIEDKLIVVGSNRIKIPDVFKQKFRCIEYNINLSNNDNIINSKWYNIDPVYYNKI